MATQSGKNPNPKSKFSTQNLEALIRKVNKDPTLLEGDWRDLVRDHFELSEKEERNLAATPLAKVKKIQDFLAEAAQNIRKGKAITGKLVKRSPEEQQKTGLTFDVDIDYAPAKGSSNKKD
jgi:hypothetical protein